MRFTLSLLLCAVHLSVAVNGFRTGLMGAINKNCDDGVTDIKVDWDPKSRAEYTCDGGPILTPVEFKTAATDENKTDEPSHVCLPTPIHYKKTPPMSGNHRPNWAKYGEYTYVPPQRWLHNLEHGAIVMLYHPCTDRDQVNQLRSIVTQCLRRHVITPYKLLPRETPLALLSWGHRLLMSRVNATVAIDYIKSHATQGSPEKNVAGDGKYNIALNASAEIVDGSNYQDANLCPNVQVPHDVAVPADNTPPGGANSLQRQSQKRVRGINKVTERLKLDVKRLIQTYRKLVSEK